MRVLMLHNFYRQPGGEDACFFAEVELLRQHGHQVQTIEMHNDQTQRLSPLSLGTETIWSRRSYTLVRKSIAEFKPDVMHCHNIFPLLSPSVYYAAKKSRVPVVQTLHNYRLLCLKATLFREGHVCESCIGHRVPWHGVTRRCYHDSLVHSVSVASMLTVHRVLRTWTRQVDLFLAVSAFARSMFVRGGFDPNRVVVKSNFVSVEPAPGPGDGGYALFVGRLSEEKGLVTVLEAWKRTKSNPRLLIVGDGPLRVLEQTLSSDGRVRFLGHRSRSEVFELMQRAMFLIAASEWYETFGLSIIEAFACGTPVIAARIGAFTELVEPGVTGLFFPAGDVTGLQAAIDRVIASPSRLQGMRHAARKRFDERFSRDKNYDALIAAYALARRLSLNSALVLRDLRPRTEV